MGNNVKIGQFIKEERKKLSLSQEELARKLGVTRQAVSRWERGICLPDYYLVSIICEIFKITANEFLVGERIKKENEKEINDLSITILKNEKNKRRKLFISLSLIIIFLILSFLIFYFFNTYKKVEVYMASGKSEKFEISNTLMMVTNDEVHFNFSGLKANNDTKKIKEIYLYFLKNDDERKIFSDSCQNYCSPEKFTRTIIQRKGGNEYFEYDDLEILKENLYVKITYLEDEKEQEENFKLDFKQMYINNNLLFQYKDENDLEPINEEENNFQENLKEKVIKNNFIHKEENDTGNEYYVKKYQNDVKVKFYMEPKLITIENNKDYESFIFNYETNEYHFVKTKDDKILESSVMFNKEISCDYGHCSNHKEYYDYYITKYIEPLFN